MADVARLAGRLAADGLARAQREPARPADTRDRVHDAVRKLGYRPNSVARALVTGRSRTLGVV